MQITKTVCQDIRLELEVALAPIIKKYELNLVIDTMKFTSETIYIPITGTVDSTEYKAKTISALNTRLEAGMKRFGLNKKKNDFTGHILLEYHSNRPKFPFIHKDKDGKRWKIDAIRASELYR